MIRRFNLIPDFVPKTRKTVRIESIVLPHRPITDHISVGSTRRESSVPSSSCFSVISIASILITSADTIKCRNSVAFIDQKM